MTDHWCLCKEGDADLTLCGCGGSRDDEAELAAALLVVTGGQLLHGAALLSLLESHMATRERYDLTSSVLPLPFESDWAQLDRHGTDAHFIHMMGIPRRDFERLLEAFVPHYAIGSGEGRPGRPTRLAGYRSALAVTLQFYASNSDTKHLCSTFGCPPATLLRILSRAEEALEVSLSTLTDTEIRWPTAREQLRWASWITEREPIVQQKFGFIDGKKLPSSGAEVRPHAKRPVQWMVALLPCHCHYCLWRGRVHLPGLMERWRHEPGVP
ncbi:hypothetical protein PsorP6_007174 [Peronosclerospora sorghi]|uniref:Uncharacterized protein n=1 Tax=Peronosclerospora sorghi TaxID=230839 RepID=A0ACC0W804_9STRA|nr:hypothetical protein PsorP6_007174 [Peronosclerospora sorghi]